MGTLINVAAIIVASILGVLLKKGLPEKIQKSIMLALGLGLIAVSLGWFLQEFFSVDVVNARLSTSRELLIIVSLVIGILIGEWIDIDRRLSNFAENLEKKYNLPPLARGFIAATLIFCVGALSIMGPINDALNQDLTILLMKSLLDFITALILASIFGIGVIFSAVSVLIFQGGIYLLAPYADQYLTTEITSSVFMVGYILLIAIGFNFMEIKKIKVANMLPALVVPILYYLVISLF